MTSAPLIKFRNREGRRSSASSELLGAARPQPLRVAAGVCAHARRSGSQALRSMSSGAWFRCRSANRFKALTRLSLSWSKPGAGSHPRYR